jgi:hypothetical protein
MGSALSVETRILILYVDLSTSSGVDTDKGTQDTKARGIDGWLVDGRCRALLRTRP